jgi:hypothetical protein
MRGHEKEKWKADQLLLRQFEGKGETFLVFEVYSLDTSISRSLIYCVISMPR